MLYHLNLIQLSFGRSHVDRAIVEMHATLAFGLATFGFSEEVSGIPLVLG